MQILSSPRGWLVVNQHEIYEKTYSEVHGLPFQLCVFPLRKAGSVSLAFGKDTCSSGSVIWESWLTQTDLISTKASTVLDMHSFSLD